MKHLLRSAVLPLLSLLFLAPCTAPAQSATPVPRLDLDQFTQPWYEQGRLPNKREKPCINDTVILYSLGDKKNAFQLVISCIAKKTVWQSWNQNGKLSPAGSGALRLRGIIWPFTSPYWVVGAPGDMQWLLVGTPNHKSLWLLTRTQNPAPEALSQMRSKAAAQGYDLSKLIPVVQHSSPLPGTTETTQNPNARPQAAPQSPNPTPR